MVSGTPPGINPEAAMTKNTHQNNHADVILASLGLASTPKLYVPGGVDSPGVVSRRNWLALPDAIEQASAVKNRIDAEKRQDFEVEARTLRLSDQGNAYRQDNGTRGGPLAVERRGLYLLLARLNPLYPRAFHVMVRAPAPARAKLFNDILLRDADALLVKGKDKEPVEVRLRTRQNGPHTKRSIFAVTAAGSARSYAPMDGDEIAGAVIAALDGLGARGRAHYDPYTTRCVWEAWWHKPPQAEDTGIACFGARINTRDDTGSSIYVHAQAMLTNGAVICLDKLLQRRHVGNPYEVRKLVEEAVERVVATASEFVVKWSMICNLPVSSVKVWGENHESAEKLLAAGVAKKKLDVGVAQDALLALLYKSLDGDTLGSVVTAVAGSAMNSPLETQSALEGAAGELLVTLYKAAVKADLDDVGAWNEE